MGRGMRWLGLVLLAALSGCAGLEPEHAPALFRKSKAFALPRDYVQLDLALLERPLGDAYINNALWDNVDENIVGLEERSAVDANGFRVGQIVGMPPAGLQALWQSKRSCLTPRALVVPTGAAAAHAERPCIVLGPVQMQSRFVLNQDGRAIDVALDDAEYQLEVEPTLTKDGRIRLRFTPRVQHGQLVRTVVVPPDRTDFALQVGKPSARYPRLAWEITVAPNEYVVIGGNFDQPQSLGYQAFAREDGRIAQQRLLMFRATRSRDGSETDLPTLDDPGRCPGPAALALQPTRSAFRANAP